MARKTVSVEAIKERVNTMLSVPNSSLYMKAPGKDREMTPEEAFRMGASSVLESVLHQTGNYRGFGYRDMRPNGEEIEVPDETKRIYY